MSLENYHWDRFYLHMYYHSDIEKVFDSWTTSAGKESFFVRECHAKRANDILEKKKTFEKGDQYQYLWEDGAKSEGEILEVDKEKHLFIFSFAGAKVRVKLEQKPLGVLLELKHYDIPESSQVAQQLDCRSGWTHFLVNLKCVLEKGVDIREENPLCGGTLGWGIYPPEGLILD